MKDKTISIMDAQGKHLSIDTYTPHRDVDRRFRDALGYLVFKWAFYSQTIYDNMSLAYTTSAIVPIAATDSFTIFNNPQGFIDHDITDVLEVAFVQAHEVSHRVLNHIEIGIVLQSLGYVQLKSGERLPYVDQLMGWAMDYVINAGLVSGGVGRMPKIGLYDKTMSEFGMESCIEVYEKLWRKHGKDIIKLSSFDVHLRPARPRQTPKDKAKLDQEIIAAAMLQERMKQGKLPGSLQRIIDELIHPKIKWSDHLRTVMTRNAGTKELDWAKQNRRLAGRNPPLYAAGIRHKGAGSIVCIGDNSGSITQKITKVFGGEMGGIVEELNPSRLTVIWCDAKVTRVDEVEEPADLAELFGKWKTEGVGGGGGTDFRPAFEKIEEMEIEPDFVVFFSDGMGTYPKEAPPFPVIWAMTTNKQPPFGEVVRVTL